MDTSLLQRYVRLVWLDRKNFGTANSCSSLQHPHISSFVFSSAFVEARGKMGNEMHCRLGLTGRMCHGYGFASCPTAGFPLLQGIPPVKTWTRCLVRIHWFPQFTPTEDPARLARLYGTSSDLIKGLQLWAFFDACPILTATLLSQNESSSLDLQVLYNCLAQITVIKPHASGQGLEGMLFHSP